MPAITDQTYLLQEQYKDAANLDARVQLHLLFSTNKYGWHRWCFDQYALPADARILEIGCGPAHLWTTNLDRVPPDWHITLSDFSGGMLAHAQQNLNGAPQFQFEVVDAQSIPFEVNTFDAVSANHMLYHVPDRSKALSEMRRVLRPDGKVYLATNGLKHLRELDDLHRRFDPHADFGWNQTSPQFFSLDTGSPEVTQFFKDVHIIRYDDALLVTEAEPLVNYILSMTAMATLQNRRAELRHFIAEELAQQGAIYITKESGMFIGTKG